MVNLNFIASDSCDKKMVIFIGELPLHGNIHCSDGN